MFINIILFNLASGTMADHAVYTNLDLLCFASFAINRVANKPLKSLISDFFTPDIIALAKGMLLDAVDSHGEHSDLKITRRWRDSLSKPGLDVDDIITLFTYLDEHNISLPMFLSSSPDRMPSIRLVEGDLKIMWAKLDNLQESLLKIEQSIADILETGKVNSDTMIHAAIDVKAKTATCTEVSRSVTKLSAAVAALTVGLPVGLQAIRVGWPVQIGLIGLILFNKHRIHR